MIDKLNARNRYLTSTILLIGGLFLVQAEAQETPALQGFDQSPFFDEQIVTFRLNEDMTIHINAASMDSFRTDLPVGLVLYALPNGNTIEHSVGKVIQTGDDWHYNIQHIGAQTRFLREQIQDYNLVTVYLESSQLSWPSWKTQFPNYDDITRETVEYLLSCFAAYDPFIVLSSHSGGGRFIFSYLDGVTEIPDYIKRICFLDSNYGYEHSYGDQLITWLNGSPDRFLSVLAYNDSIALYNGEPIVSPTGGTWYRTRRMQAYLANHYDFLTVEDDSFIHHEAIEGRIEIILKKNPTQAILHTVQVERNGFIHTLLSGTDQARLGYTYYGERSYEDLIQPGILARSPYQIPLRSMSAQNGTQFMASLVNMSFGDRENAILNQLRTGNVPYFLRDLKNITANFEDAGGVPHMVSYAVMPDYLSIGTDTNYCRIPMGPITAQRAADFFGLIMPTRKLVDNIYANSDIHLAPVTYAPVGNQNEGIPKFIEHNTAIEGQLITAGANLGQLIGGTKKDVVLSNLIIDPARLGHVSIYGWHRLNGSPIQPLTNIHTNTYVDYSHGIRYMDARVTIDGVVNNAVSVLQNSVQYKLLSDESGPMIQPTYIPDGSLPSRPTSFGARSQNSGEVEIFIEPDPNILDYQLLVSSDGLIFDQPAVTVGNTHTLGDLDPGSTLYFKLIAENLSGSSGESEVLAVLPNGVSNTKVLVVNGFDRSSSGNTYDFIRHHGSALLENGSAFESCTNDAILDGLVLLSDYLIVDYILGEESTADETFSTAEQSLITTYLQQGGRLFVSGAEIAWDLDYRGTTSDKAFIHNFLKASYSADAPGGVSGTHYSAEGIQGSMLGDINTITYDNGTHGTFDVKYPDALIPGGGSQSIIRYLNVNSHDIGGVSFEGLFPSGTQPGKLVYFGFPFETIYPLDSRNLVMTEVLDFLLIAPSATEEFVSTLPEAFELMQNFPNPFNPSTTLRFGVPRASRVNLTIYNVRGQAIKTMVDHDLPAGWHDMVWEGNNNQNQQVATGLYLARLRSGNQVKNVKMLYLN